MLTLRVKVDFATFRNPFAREYRATEILPPPSTCYGFLLSLAGLRRDKYEDHTGVRIMPALLNKPEKSVILRKVHRFKSEQIDAVGNSIPDFQEILTHVDLLMFVDSSEEEGAQSLEEKVKQAILHPETVDRYGPLCLGESENLVNSVDIIEFKPECNARGFVLKSDGLMSLTTWPDYLQCYETQWARGDLEPLQSIPTLEMMPRITPPPLVASSGSPVKSRKKK